MWTVWGQRVGGVSQGLPYTCVQNTSGTTRKEHVTQMLHQHLPSFPRFLSLYISNYTQKKNCHSDKKKNWNPAFNPVFKLYVIIKRNRKVNCLDQWCCLGRDLTFTNHDWVSLLRPLDGLGQIRLSSSLQTQVVKKLDYLTTKRSQYDYNNYKTKASASNKDQVSPPTPRSIYISHYTNHKAEVTKPVSNPVIKIRKVNLSTPITGL